ncbi:hypothetical protein J6590_014973, partial [Homalodisca vitripennis]
TRKYFTIRLPLISIHRPSTRSHCLESPAVGNNEQKTMHGKQPAVFPSRSTDSHAFPSQGRELCHRQNTDAGCMPAANLVYSRESVIMRADRQCQPGEQQTEMVIRPSSAFQPWEISAFLLGSSVDD